MLESWRLFNALLNPIKGESPKCPVFLSLQIRSDQAPHRSSESRWVMSDSLWPNGLYSPWNSPGQNTGGGSLFLLQGIFPTQGSNPGVPHCRWILYQLSHKGTQVQPVNKSLILSSNNPTVTLPGILSSTWNLIKSSKAPGSCQGGWSGASELSHTSSSASQWETERSQRSRVGTSDNGTLRIFHHSFFREGNKCLVLFHHYITYNNQKSVPTIFFFFK